MPAPFTNAEVDALLGTVERGVTTDPFVVNFNGLPTEFDLTGTQDTEAAGLTADYTTDFSCSNNHVSILVNSITTGGTIVITGDVWNESTGEITLGVTENITVDTTAGQLYQSLGKFQVVSNVDVSGTTGIDYDLGCIGYFDAANRPFSVRGYRLDVKTSSATADFRMTITAVKNRGGNKIELVDLDDIGFDSTSSNGSLYDHVRFHPTNPSYTASTTLVNADSTQNYKRIDIDTWTDANIEEGVSNIFGNNDEGIIISIAGEPSGGFTGLELMTLFLSLGNVTS
jgi:hypothetical protein